MFNFFKKQKDKSPEADVQTSEVQPIAEQTLEVEHQEIQPKQNLFARLRAGLKKTRDSLGAGLKGLFSRKAIDAELLDELESRLLMADLGPEVVTKIIEDLTKKSKANELNDGPALFRALRKELLDILTPHEKPLHIEKTGKPTVILMVGVNGAGKTTTIGKLAKKYQNEGLSVMLAAGDTFRAAAVEQLQVWGERNNVPVIAQKAGADSAAVAFDALQAAQARGIDVLITDTAGRLHTQSGLMDELAKVKRVIQRLDGSAPHEILLILDAGIGQNALVQAHQFHEKMGVTGICLTKLDGTAKGGIIFAICHELGLPIRFIGIGEQAEDLRPFEAEAFVDALLQMDEE
jgi:fused signal recognition particle receptor